MNNPLIILGNGPSLANTDFQLLKDKHTFGMNRAYKLFQKINWVPKYWGLLEHKETRDYSDIEVKEFMTSKLAENIEKMFLWSIENEKFKLDRVTFFQPIIPKQEDDFYDKTRFSKPWQFFVHDVMNEIPRYMGDESKKLINKCVELFTNNEVVKEKLTVSGVLKMLYNQTLTDDDYLKISRYNMNHALPTSIDKFYHFNSNAGATACRIGICLGYKKIILIGVDCSLKIVDGWVEDKGSHCIEGYYEGGKRYVGKGHNVIACHLDGWNTLAKAIEINNINVEIVNCTPITNVNCFRKSTLEKEL
jgi:hypothetical protein